MFFRDDEIEQLRTGVWESDCYRMTLTQNESEQPARFAGQGYLRQKEDGTIHYQIYPSEVSGFDLSRHYNSGGLAGRLIERSRYYRLEAEAQNGASWVVARTIPEPGGTHAEDGFHHLVSGKASAMTFSRPSELARAVEKSYLKMVFFDDVKIPCNASTERVVSLAGERLRKSSSLDAATFVTSQGDFRISRGEGTVVVEVNGERPFPPHFETRVVEALMFVLAKPLYWNVIEQIEGGTLTVSVRGRPQVVAARLPRPLTGRHEEFDVTGQAWQLFGKYLALVCGHAGGGFHPCSRYLFSVLEASAGGISARGLALGVAAEGIAKEMFPDAGAPMAGMKDAATRLRKHCLAWGGFPDGDLGESMRRRLPGMIGQLLNVSTKDKLHALAREKAICEDHIKAWGDLRNALAHGSDPASDDLQRQFDLCQQVTVLMYHLIFKAIGYEGHYEDYSTHGWPTRRYRGRPVTEEEIAVAAYFIYLKSDGADGNDQAHWFAGKEQLEQGWA